MKTLLLITMIAIFISCESPTQPTTEQPPTNSIGEQVDADSINIQEGEKFRLEIPMKGGKRHGNMLLYKKTGEIWYLSWIIPYIDGELDGVEYNIKTREIVTPENVHLYRDWKDTTYWERTIYRAGVKIS
jgi:hypothetical protein